MDFEVLRRFGIPEVGAISFSGNCNILIGVEMPLKCRVAIFLQNGGSALLHVLDNSSTYHIKNVFITTECKQNKHKKFLKCCTGIYLLVLSSFSRLGGHKDEMTHKNVKN